MESSKELKVGERENEVVMVWSVIEGRGRENETEKPIQPSSLLWPLILSKRFIIVIITKITITLILFVLLTIKPYFEAKPGLVSWGRENAKSISAEGVSPHQRNDVSSVLLLMASDGEFSVLGNGIWWWVFSFQFWGMQSSPYCYSSHVLSETER